MVVTCYNLHICHITQQGNRKWTRQSLGLNHWSAQSHSNEEGANICKHRTNINIIIDLINHHGHWKNSTVFDLFLFHKKIAFCYYVCQIYEILIYVCRIVSNKGRAFCYFICLKYWFVCCVWVWNNFKVTIKIKYYQKIGASFWYCWITFDDLDFLEAIS